MKTPTKCYKCKKKFTYDNNTPEYLRGFRNIKDTFGKKTVWYCPICVPSKKRGNNVKKRS